MTKREAELQRCLEKTLKDVDLALRCMIVVDTYTILHGVHEDITRTLRKGELRKKEGK